MHASPRKIASESRASRKLRFAVGLVPINALVLIGLATFQSGRQLGNYLSVSVTLPLLSAEHFGVMSVFRLRPIRAL